MIGAVEFEHGLIVSFEKQLKLFPLFVLRTTACRSKFGSQTSDNMDR